MDKKTPSTSMPPIRLEGIQPILYVKSMAMSRAFYVGVLGFTEAPWGDDSFTSVNRDGTGIYLCQGAQGNPGTWLWIGFDGDIEELYNYLRKNDVTIRMPPGNFSWALEMHIEDPDGHILRFGKEPDSSQPFLDRPSR
ncbi:MAG TPA: VOC family protein [Ohtaekwangia sp.]|uniref:VOC family protein n=1 Tax=Ohtaekwangia sp. TaxID=2066019 RepID=UPI002F93CF5E